MTSVSILEPAEGIVKEKVVKRGEKLRAIGILIVYWSAPILGRETFKPSLLRSWLFISLELMTPKIRAVLVVFWFYRGPRALRPAPCLTFFLFRREKVSKENGGPAGSITGSGVSAAGWRGSMGTRAVLSGTEGGGLLFLAP
jgi:hypothetical protein